MSAEQFQIYMFHFRCPVCGPTPERVLLREYLKEWSATPPERLYMLLCAFSGTLAEVASVQSGWLTREFSKAVKRVERALNDLPFDPPLCPDSSLHAAAVLRDAVPGVSLRPRPRTAGNYFTDWPYAYKVQTANLLYETGLILWAGLPGLPEWAASDFLRRLNTARSEIRRAGKDMSFLECPQCGRLTNCLYGSNAKVNGFCRWCLDMGGGLGLGLSVAFDPDGRPVIRMTKTDHILRVGLKIAAVTMLSLRLSSVDLQTFKTKRLDPIRKVNKSGLPCWPIQKMDVRRASRHPRSCLDGEREACLALNNW